MGKLTFPQQRLLQNFRTVENSGNKMGILKPHLIYIAESLVEKGYLNYVAQGRYELATKFFNKESP
ncbi:winged helix-turn-helix DNA-binding domain protein [Vibrio phage 1.188.A._10N.286.51.A6]|uniref:Winged helix-turn-helix DNA-binding domain protein n=6 Tax=Mukerjeevirus TaxID=2733146 RepID=A0A2I7REH0_9CAUD|nr:winged helix-turn-helix DNA-binding domain protein [Vibrio phage 1.169.O._10N.261.52.B1]YP_009817465.1 winged helix-turn-helix DNA-binding domain protein [Vibrio phage 1.188.A._10N.286.51.A6]YP_009817606.1 winged helix-turn-helix DNA-binding domain protein [Vibrio phage 1.224.A._10N.261.48.B1]YP_009817692.1 winged helix-turn-helix DNA-binding domain protein [Vibrio phage 1.261.O._10N.286.51.A7]AUR93660.1 winged helix-turn-helix DNA-binding domain protein [Vibrio phage 1.188.B._10N.286.51.A6]